MCAAGYEGVGSPGEGCTQCRAGRVKAFAGNAACTDCLAGQGSAAGATACYGKTLISRELNKERLRPRSVGTMEGHLYTHMYVV